MKNQSLYDAIGWIAFIGIVMLFTLNMCGCGISKTGCNEPIGAYHVKDANTH